MKKGTLLGIVCSVIALILLAALAVFLAWQFHDDAFSTGDTQAAIAADAAIQALYQTETSAGTKTKDADGAQAADENGALTACRNADADKSGAQDAGKDADADKSGAQVTDKNAGAASDAAGAQATGKDVDADKNGAQATGKNAGAAGAQASDKPAAEAESETSGTEAQTEFVPLEVYDVPFPVIWVGDSRTLGMGRALDTTDTYIGKDGEGYNWFMEEGLALTANAIAEQPDAPVVLNFGVNDYDNLANYLALYAELLAAYPDTHFYFLSVNPIEPTLCSNISNEQIADFNSHLKEAFPDAYIDSFTLLMIDQVMPIDGVHYSAEDYQKIYNFAARQIEAKE